MPSRSSSRVWPAIAAALALVDGACWHRAVGASVGPRTRSVCDVAGNAARSRRIRDAQANRLARRKEAHPGAQSERCAHAMGAVAGEPVAQEIRGAEDAVAVFWHLTASRWRFAQEKLKRVDLASPSVQVLADAPSGRGGTWNRNGGIVFAPASGDALYRVPESGEPTKITELDTAREEQEHLFLFPVDDRTFLYLSRKPDEREPHHGCLLDRMRIAARAGEPVARRIRRRLSLLDERTVCSHRRSTRRR